MSHGITINQWPICPNELIHRARKYRFVLENVPGIRGSVESSIEICVKVAVHVTKGEKCGHIRSLTRCIQGWQLITWCVSIITDEFVNVCIVRECVLAVYNVWTVHDLLPESDSEPDALLPLSSPLRNIVVPQPQNESDLLDPSEVMSEIFHRIVARKIHHSAHCSLGHGGVRVGRLYLGPWESG